MCIRCSCLCSLLMLLVMVVLTMLCAFGVVGFVVCVCY